MNSQCYLCSSESRRTVHEGARDNPDLVLVECQVCRLQQLTSFDHISDDHYIESHMTYPATGIPDNDRRVEMLKNIVLGKSVMDFGSGLGTFCFEIKKYAHRVVAVDLDPQATKNYQLNNVPFYQNAAEMPEEKFDYITMFHVLEHLMDPIEQLKSLRDLLKLGGSIYAEVPNADDALITLYGSEEFLKFNTWGGHLFTFTADNLKTMARRCDLEVNFVRQVQRYPLSNHFLWVQKGTPRGHIVYDCLNNDLLNETYATTLGSLGACDTLVAKFTKRQV